VRLSAKYNEIGAQFVPSDRDIEPIRLFYLGLGLDRLEFGRILFEMKLDRIARRFALILARTTLAAFPNSWGDRRAWPDLTDSIDLAHLP
jgi:hypothetical protein